MGLNPQRRGAAVSAEVMEQLNPVGVISSNPTDAIGRNLPDLGLPAAYPTGTRDELLYIDEGWSAPDQVWPAGTILRNLDGANSWGPHIPSPVAVVLPVVQDLTSPAPNATDVLSTAGVKAVDDAVRSTVAAADAKAQTAVDDLAIEASARIAADDALDDRIDGIVANGSGATPAEAAAIQANTTKSNQNETDISTLQSEQTTQDSDISALQTTQGNQGTDISSLQTSDGNQDTSIANLTSTQGTHTSQIGTLQTEQTTQDSAISATTSKADANETAIANINEYPAADAAKVAPLPDPSTFTGSPALSLLRLNAAQDGYELVAPPGIDRVELTADVAARLALQGTLTAEDRGTLIRQNDNGLWYVWTGTFVAPVTNNLTANDLDNEVSDEYGSISPRRLAVRIDLAAIKFKSATTLDLSVELPRASSGQVVTNSVIPITLVAATVVDATITDQTKVKVKVNSGPISEEDVATWEALPGKTYFWRNGTEYHAWSFPTVLPPLMLTADVDPPVPFQPTADHNLAMVIMTGTEAGVVQLPTKGGSYPLGFQFSVHAPDGGLSTTFLAGATSTSSNQSCGAEGTMFFTLLPGDAWLIEGGDSP